MPVSGLLPWVVYLLVDSTVVRLYAAVIKLDYVAMEIAPCSLQDETEFEYEYEK
jgi:hypothetical protein